MNAIFIHVSVTRRKRRCVGTEGLRDEELNSIGYPKNL